MLQKSPLLIFAGLSSPDGDFMGDDAAAGPGKVFGVEGVSFLLEPRRSCLPLADGAGTGEASGGIGIGWVMPEFVNESLLVCVCTDADREVGEGLAAPAANLLRSTVVIRSLEPEE